MSLMTIKRWRMMIGYQWDCPWRLQWRRRFEYWYRTQVGPFYVLNGRDDTRENVNESATLPPAGHPR